MKTVLYRKTLMKRLFRIRTLFLVLSVFTWVSCTSGNRNPASEGEEGSFLSSLFNDEPGPRATPLIDNKDALQARHDVWNNPNAKYFFMSTFEFEEDSVGMAQVEWAVKRAKEKKVVHLVLDAAGHKLSQETIYYMVSNGVNVHIWSPMFSFRGMKNRYRLNRTGNGRIKAALKAAFKQASFRMHDKILMNDAVDPKNAKLLGSSSNIGDLILGGRNARESHYGIDDASYVRQFADGSVKMNPQFEYEHEVMAYSDKAHREATAYTNNLLNSRFTERVNPAKMRKQFEWAKKMRNSIGQNWRAVLIEQRLKNEKGFIGFSSDLSRWIEQYQASKGGEISDDAAKAMAQSLEDILQKHSNSLTSLIRRGKLSPKYLATNFEQILDPESAERLRLAATQFDIDQTTGTLIKKGDGSAEDFFKTVLLGEVNVSKLHTEKLIKFGEFDAVEFKRLQGPFDGARRFSRTLAGLYSKLFGIKFNLASWEGVGNRVKLAEQKLKSSGLVSEVTNWIDKSIPVDDIKFVHDTVDNDLMTKRVMNAAWDFIASSEGQVTFNSQYGTPTPHSFNAMDDFLAVNSAAYRLAHSELDRGGVGVDREVTDEVHQKLVTLFKANDGNIVESLVGPEAVKGVGNPGERLKENKLQRKQFMSNVKKLFNDSTKLSEGNLARELRLAGAAYLQEPTSRFAAEKYIATVISVAERSGDVFFKSIELSKDNVEENIVGLRGFVDEDPNKILGDFTPNKLEFMTNDRKSWAVGADDAIHNDWHLAMEHRWRRMGRGLDMYGFNEGGRIHSKVIAAKDGVLVWSANADYRSEYKNTEVGAMITTKRRGKEVSLAFQEHVQSYMHNQVQYMQNGRNIKPSGCAGWIQNLVLKSFLRSQL